MNKAEYKDLPPEREGYTRIFVRAHKQGSVWREAFWRYRKIGAQSEPKMKSEEQPKKKRGLAALPKWRRVEIARSGAAARFNKAKRKESVLNAINEQWVPVYSTEAQEEPSGWLDITSGKFITRQEVTPGMTGVLRSDLKIIGKVGTVLTPSSNGDHFSVSRKSRSYNRSNRGIVFEVIEALRAADPEIGMGSREVAAAIKKSGRFKWTPVGTQSAMWKTVGTTMAGAARSRKYGIVKISRGQYALKT